MADTSIEVSRTVTAPPERVFALLADPDRHPDLDGSGMVRSSGTHLAITELGDVFVMHMHNELFGDYDIANVVTVYEPDRALGWAPGPVGEDSVGHTYTWRLDPADDGDDTVVTVTYDWSAVTLEWLLPYLPVVTREQLETSLAHLDEMLA
jgi:uncharacterized protein YndB with AHSA1/START domain